MRQVLIITSNIIIMIAIGLGLVQYASSQHRSSIEAEEQAFMNTAEIISGIADNYLQDTQTVCDGWANYINANDMNMEEAVEYLQETKAVDPVSAHILWQDTLRGVSITEKASDPGNYRVDYSDELRSVFDDVSINDGIWVTARYNDPMTGEYVLAFCRRIRLLDERGQKKDGILMRVVPVSYLEKQWVFPSDYTNADVALIKKDGEYILKPNSMKNESFFSYVYSYNRGIINQKELTGRVGSEELGHFYGKNAEGKDCIWVYCSLKKEDGWSIVACLPREEIQGISIDWFVTGILILGLALILAIDVIYFLFLIRGRRIIQRQLEEQTAELQTALLTERENKLIVRGISREYNSLWVVKEPELELVLIQENESGKEAVFKRIVKEHRLYGEVMKSYAGQYVYEADRAGVLAACSLENVKRQLKTQNVFSVSYRRVLDGAPEYYQLSFAATDRETGFVVGFRDIDELMAEKQKQADDLAAALAAAEHASRAKTVFLNNMSHDIRTPMNAIIGFTALASAHIQNQEQVKDYLSKIALSGEHLLSLINDVLDMSRIESGKVKVEEREMHLPDLFHDIRAIVQTNVRARNLELLMDAVDIRHEDIIADKLRLSQILLNIVGNAIKFTKPGGKIIIRVIEQKDAPEGYASFQFLVKDTGIGMTREFQEHIFEAFTREETSTVSGIQGSGLGMAITKNIVDIMGGTITVTSEVNVGTEFTVKLQFRTAGHGSAIQAPPQLQDLPVLVADNDSHTCASVTKMLKDMGLRAQCATTGEEAESQAKLARDRGDEFQAYLVEWMGPEWNGLEVIRSLRRIADRKIPVILMTAYDWSDVREEALEAGATGFCSKPVFMSELLMALTISHEEQEEAVQESLPRFAGKRILLVEDNELNQEIAGDILRDVGLQVDIASDGTEAVSIMKNTSPGVYDLILMDIQMPHMNGYEATRQIRSLPDKAIARIPIIAMTADAFEEDKRLAMEAGMDDHISKPVDVQRLMNVLQSIFGYCSPLPFSPR